MEAKFTKGAWSAQDKITGFSIFSDGQYLAFIGDTDKKTPAKANAHLIASAPLMYNELERINHRLIAGNLDEWSIKALVDIINKTLSKARGEK